MIFKLFLVHGALSHLEKKFTNTKQTWKSKTKWVGREGAAEIFKIRVTIEFWISQVKTTPGMCVRVDPSLIIESVKVNEQSNLETVKQSTKWEEHWGSKASVFNLLDTSTTKQIMLCEWKRGEEISLLLNNEKKQINKPATGNLVQTIM